MRLSLITSTATYFLTANLYCSPARPKTAAKELEIISIPQGQTVFTIIKVTAPRAYLFQPASFGAHEGQRVILVDIGDDRSHAVPVLREDGNATYHLGHTQGCIHIQATEVIING